MLAILFSGRRASSAKWCSAAHEDRARPLGEFARPRAQALTGGIGLVLLLGLAALLAWPLVFIELRPARVHARRHLRVLVLGYQFIFGHAGALALTQGTFFGVGAYITGCSRRQFRLGFRAHLAALSISAPLVLALIVAAPVLRLESHYFALATLGIGQVMLLLAISWEPLTGGANGLPGVPGVVLFGYGLPRGLPLAAFVWAIVAIAALDRVADSSAGSPGAPSR